MLQITLRGEVDACDANSDDGEEDLIFSTKQNLHLSQSNSQWRGDQTFECSAAIVYQPFEIYVGAE